MDSKGVNMKKLNLIKKEIDKSSWAKPKRYLCPYCGSEDLTKYDSVTESWECMDCGETFYTNEINWEDIE